MLHKLVKQKSTMFTNATTADFLALNICVDALLRKYRYDDYVMLNGNDPKLLKEKQAANLKQLMLQIQRLDMGTKLVQQ